MKNRGILIKLLMLVVISVAAFCVMGLFGIFNSRKIYASVDRVQLTAEQFQRFALRITGPLNELRQLTLTMVMAPDPESHQELHKEQEALTSQVDETFQGWNLAEVSPIEKQVFVTLRARWEDYKALKDFTVAKVLDGHREEAFINAIQAESEQFKLVNDQVRLWQQVKTKQAEAANQDASRSFDRALWISAVVIAVMTVLVGGVGFVTTRMIIGPIEALKNAAAKISSRATVASLGDALDETIKINSRDELGALASAFNQMVENLRAAMEKLSLEEKRTLAIFNSTADGIVTIDEQGQIRSFNAAAEALLKYRADEVVGQEVSQFVPALSNGSGREFSDQPLQPGESRLLGGESETFGLHREGRHIPLALRVTELEYSGERLFIATIQDITLRKQAEEERTRLFNEIREHANHLSRANEERSRLFDTIRETANQLSTASAEISATMVHQTQGTERQTSAVSRTVSVVARAAQTAEESKYLAKDVAETAKRADDVSKSGRSAIEETRISMNHVREQVEFTAKSILRLAERAQAIGEIIEAVNDIAEQTNVLALNAAVEASRAGAAGKGFSVVAAEVKSLAEQAKKATGQVRGILGEIQRSTNKAVLSTEHGTKSVGEANRVVALAEETIDELGKMVSEAASAAAEIVAASSQQADGMQQVTISMNEIDRTAKETFTATKQTARAANDLYSLGTQLKELIEGDASTSETDRTLDQR